MKIGIAGAGLLGRLLAFELARTGHQVDVFDPAPDALGRGAAGWTAAGMLSPIAELEGADAAVFAMGLRSLVRWPQLIEEVGQASHESAVEFHQRGSLLVAHRGDEGAARRVVDLLKHKAPPEFAPQALAMPELCELEPAIHGCAHAWMLPGEGQIHTVQAMTALYQAATQIGAQWHWGESVQHVSAGVLHAAKGERQFDWVFDVRGTGARPSATNQFNEDAGFTPQVRGVRGEIFWLDAPEVVLHRPVRLLHPRHRVYIVPRQGGQIVVGASEIESEDRSPVSLRTTLELLSAAYSILPELAEARIVHSESNLRPALPDNLPRLETSPGITRINGLFRHGWLIAPALVEQAMAEMQQFEVVKQVKEIA
jgi:glycine oxidase